MRLQNTMYRKNQRYIWKMKKDENLFSNKLNNTSRSLNNRCRWNKIDDKENDVGVYLKK